MENLKQIVNDLINTGIEAHTVEQHLDVVNELDKVANHIHQLLKCTVEYPKGINAEYAAYLDTAFQDLIIFELTTLKELCENKSTYFEAVAVECEAA